MSQPTSADEDVRSAEPESPGLVFPLGWLLDRGGGAIAYRAYTEVAELDTSSEPRFSLLPLTPPTALRLAMTQSLDGTWHRSMLSFPNPGARIPDVVGTIPATQRLLEYGWGKETPPVLHVRRILFRLLIENSGPTYLFETAAASGHPDAIWLGWMLLREAAAATLARAGYESDPRLLGAARRILERVDAFLYSPLAEKPWVRVGNRHVLSAEAAPPSIYTLAMLAYMPLFRSEHFPEMERLYAYLTQPKPTQEVVQLHGQNIVVQPHLVLGDLLSGKNVVDNDVPFALFWLETMARLGFLKRNEGWMALFQRLVDGCDQTGVWHPHRGSAAPSSANPYVWPMFPLEERLVGDACWTDVTFRIGLIAKLLGWRIELV